MFHQENNKLNELWGGKPDCNRVFIK